MWREGGREGRKEQTITMQMVGLVHRHRLDVDQIEKMDVVRLLLTMGDRSTRPALTLMKK